MKGTIQKLALALTAVWFTGAVTSAYGQDTIVYFSGPSLPFQYGASEPGDASLDLDRDGMPDFSFQLGYFVCTADTPTSGCSGPFYVMPLGTNAILKRFSQATILPFDALIDSPPPTNSTWSNPDQSATVATFYISERYRTSGLYGPLADAGVGYLGVRFYAADGLHYGWVRVRIAPFVAVADWAYEGRPNTPIRAGIIGTNGESLQFTVNFQGPNNTLPDRTGTFILTGNTLRGELTFAGSYSSADIARRAPARAIVKSIASLGRPLARRTDFTSFFGDATLSHPEIVHLLRGAVYVSIDNGAVVGQIAPLK